MNFMAAFVGGKNAATGGIFGQVIDARLEALAKSLHVAIVMQTEPIRGLLNPAHPCADPTTATPTRLPNA